MAYALAAAIAMPLSRPASATDQIDLDGNPANGAESKIVTRVLQSYPVKIENVITNNAIGKSFVFDWDGAGPGGFDSFVTPGPDVGTKWEWTTISQVYSILSPVIFRLSSRGIPVVGTSPGGIRGGDGTSGGTFMVAGKSISPTQVTVSSASLTSSLITFFSPEKTVATCGGTYAPGRFEQTITNETGGTFDVTVEQPDCCPEAQMTICDDGCQFYLTDRHNCGGCGVECAFDEFCSEGACEPICPPGQSLCGETCVDLTSDPGNCGACAAACDPLYRCTAGACEPDCPPGHTLCGEICVDLTSDPDHCGACGTECGTLYVCTSGACESTCPPGETVCGEVCSDLLTDEANCGACGAACDPLYRCTAGACEPDCPPGQTLCGQTCVDLLSDEANCGACGTQCGTLYACLSGTCTSTCPLGETVCGDVCADLQSDPLNCGTCGHSCGANQICTAGGCQTCRPPTGTACDNRCVNTHTDPLNCGGCGNVCDFSGCPSTGQGTCSQGDSCVCSPLAATSDVLLFAPLAPQPPPRAAQATQAPDRDRPTPRAAASTQARTPVARAASPRTTDAAGRRESRPTRGARLGSAAVSVVEAPVCDVTPLQQTIPPGGTFTRCQAGAIAGKEVFTIATIVQDGKPVAKGPCSLIVPAPETVIPPFLPSPVGVFVLDESGDGLCQPGEACQMFVSVQNIGTAAILNPIGTLASPPDAFNPLPLVFTSDTSTYPDFPAYGAGGDCDTQPQIDPKTNTLAYSVILPHEQEPDIGRVFALELLGDNGGPVTATMPFVLGVGKACNPATDIDGKTYDGLAGFLSPVDAQLVPEGGPVRYSSGSFNQTKTIPLKVRLSCGTQALGLVGVDPAPQIIAVVHATLGPQSLANINGANGANPNDPAFQCSTNGCEFQLRTRDLPIGVYVISVRMPDTRVFQAGFTLRP